ncbi:hypothetical protein ABZ490_14240 [Streptomyces sp. NPDC005811]|uniref:hypothetical protein n=1 Tax=Streptomyces sp. NPDC005811 TaxID=3154565 RepID=UPI00340F866B
MRESGAIRPFAALQVTSGGAEECHEAAALAGAPYGGLPRSEQKRPSFARRVPVGVVGVIAPRRSHRRCRKHMHRTGRQPCLLDDPGGDGMTAVAKITDDRHELLTFHDVPAEHGIHLRTTNPIESAFSTVNHRTEVTRGAGSPAAALAVVFELVEPARTRWRAITGAHPESLVRADARFENGVLSEREEQAA